MVMAAGFCCRAVLPRDRTPRTVTDATATGAGATVRALLPGPGDNAEVVTKRRAIRFRVRRRLGHAPRTPPERAVLRFARKRRRAVRRLAGVRRLLERVGVGEKLVLGEVEARATRPRPARRSGAVAVGGENPAGNVTAGNPVPLDSVPLRSDWSAAVTGTTRIF